MNKNNKEKEEELENSTQDETSQEENVQEENVAAEEESEESKLKKELETLNDKYLRQVAEFENYRKRVLAEKADLILNGGEKVLKELLPVIDDLERAINNIEQANDMSSVKEGVTLIMDKFKKYLNQQGVKEIEAVGKDFNTDFHEAVTMVPGQPEEMKGKVMDCIQTGYTLNDKVIRYSKVVVAN